MILKMMNHKYFLWIPIAVFALTFSRKSEALVVQSPQSFCTTKTPQEVHAMLTNYGDYLNYDAGMAVQFVDMIESVSRPEWFTRGRPGQPQGDTDGLVWVRLQPMRLDPSNVSHRILFPRFFLHCRSQWTGGSQDRFDHDCRWVAPPYEPIIVRGQVILPANPLLANLNNLPPHAASFGIGNPATQVDQRGFLSHVTVARIALPAAGEGPRSREPAPTSHCSIGQTLVTYSFSIDPVQQDNDRILGGILARFSFLRDTVAPLFSDTNPNNFYRLYYERFFHGWRQALDPHASNPRSL